jgi:hypothetical protein
LSYASLAREIFPRAITKRYPNSIGVGVMYDLC